MASVTLDQTLDTTKALVSHLRETLASGTSSDSANPSKPINPLALSSTAASLIKAQTTKLTLLALNKPFTPSSIGQILNTIASSPLPALITAVQICNPDRFSKFARHQLHTKALRLLKAYENLLAELPKTAEDQEAKLTLAKLRNVTGDELGQKAALIGTGLLWEACDEIKFFTEQGLAEAAAKTMLSHRSLFNDAVEEIDQWLEDGKSFENLDERMNDLGLDDTSSDSGSVDSFSSKPTKEIIPLAEWALKVLNHLSLLYPPLIKRRLRKLPEFNGKSIPESISSMDVARLDGILDAGKDWSEQIDFIAEGLFENQPQMALQRVNDLASSAVENVEAVRLAWDGSEDEFSVWVVQWLKKLQELTSESKPAP